MMRADSHNGKPGGEGQGVLGRALDLRRAGLCVLPIRRDGSKAPAAGTWPDKDADGKPRLPTEDEVRRRWGGATPPGVAVAHGAVSGNSEMIDFDRDANSIFPAWRELVEAEAPGLVARLTVVRTPREPVGFHVVYRCPGAAIGGNTKLAQEPYTDPKDGKRKLRTLIETRGEGGYGLVPGCPPDCHETNRPYLDHGGPPLTELQAITDDERDWLWRCADSFDKAGAEQGKFKDGPREATPTEGERPGDAYNARGPAWQEILGPRGWEPVRQSGAVVYWRRPGKVGKGWSATTGYCTSRDGHDLLAVFSSNAHPFEGPTPSHPCTCYTKFAAYTLLNHSGDWSDAAKELARQGYGDQRHLSNGRLVPSGPEAKTYPLDALALRLDHARRTPTRKTVAAVSVLRDGADVDQLQLTAAAGNRQEAVKRLLLHLGGGGDAATRAKCDLLLGQVLADAGRLAEQLEQGEGKRGPTVFDLVSALVPEKLGIVCRTERGLWSEALGGEMTRPAFIAHTPTWLLEACYAASDVPDTRGELIRLAASELGVLWADLMTRLPPQAGSDLGIETAAGKKFREAMLRLWTATRTFEVSKTVEGTSGESVASRATLISRVRSQAKSYLDGSVSPQARETWRPVQRAFDAWWRPYIMPGDGEISVLLAMRWRLTGQIGVELPGVTDQASLTEVGGRFGCIDPHPPVAGILSGGKTRLAVLSLSLAEELLEGPQDEEQENPDSEPVTPTGVTETGK